MLEWIKEVVYSYPLLWAIFLGIMSGLSLWLSGFQAPKVARHDRLSAWVIVNLVFALLCGSTAVWHYYRYVSGTVASAQDGLRKGHVYATGSGSKTDVGDEWIGIVWEWDVMEEKRVTPIAVRLEKEPPQAFKYVEGEELFRKFPSVDIQ